MLKIIDDYLNRTTMYRLMLYYLIVLLAAAFVISFFGLLPFGPFALLASTLCLLAVGILANYIFAKTYGVPANVESVYITALILALIISPPSQGAFFAFLPFGFFAALLAMASKYVLAINRKHIFNPAALSVALTSAFIGQSATWWVGGNLSLAPLVIIGGVLIVRKIRRTDLVLAFFIMAAAGISIASLLGGGSALTAIWKTAAHSPVFFFAFVMLTEPLTTPPRRAGRTIYGALVGILFTPMLHLGSIYSTPELALVLGNLFSYLVSPKKKLLLSLREKLIVANGVYDFVFENGGLAFSPGQYLEWTLPVTKADNRGNRRYFTIASSPTEKYLRMGVKFYPQPSTFKQELAQMNVGDQILAGQLSGDFILPSDQRKKLAFIAGGIGVTPFRSMVKYLLDRNERRDIIFFYSNKKFDEVAYLDLFSEAEKRSHLKLVNVLTDRKVPLTWRGEPGLLNREIIEKYAPDFLERRFYISGPQAMVTAIKQLLLDMGVPRLDIVTDYFPGLA